MFERKLRIPGGDAVQRVWSVADAGGYTLVSVDNDSPQPIAVAFTRRGLVTNRPPTDTPIEGMALPPSRWCSRSAIGRISSWGSPTTAGCAASVALGASRRRRRGPRARAGCTDVASRLDVPDQALVEAVRAARCEVLLGGAIDVATDPERYLLTVGELVRLGEVGAGDAVELASATAAAAEATVRRRHRLTREALDAAAVVLATAGERRALIDLARLGAALRGPDAATLVDAGSIDVWATSVDPRSRASPRGRRCPVPWPYCADGEVATSMPIAL